jgi:hypothetical protein
MRLRTTHDITVYGDRAVGENAIGQDQTAPDEPLVTVRGRFREQGEGWTRERRSPRIDRSPEVVIPTRGRDPATGEQVDIGEVIDEGQHVDVSGEQSTFQLVRVVPHHGKGQDIRRYTLELENTSDE